MLTSDGTGFWHVALIHTTLLVPLVSGINLLSNQHSLLRCYYHCVPKVMPASVYFKDTASRWGLNAWDVYCAGFLIYPSSVRAEVPPHWLAESKAPRCLDASPVAQSDTMGRWPPAVPEIVVESGTDKSATFFGTIIKICPLCPPVNPGLM